jgi:hypothetical protein
VRFDAAHGHGEVGPERALPQGGGAGRKKLKPAQREAPQTQALHAVTIQALRKTIMAIKFIDEIDVRGKRVFVRADFNVPLDEKQNITNDNRIRATIPTLKYVLDNGGAVIASRARSCCLKTCATMQRRKKTTQHSRRAWARLPMCL